MEALVRVSNLRKSYGATKAVDDISFELFAGEIFGMVGPNGAGKTTTIDCLTGQQKRDAGRISVLGLDPQADTRLLRERIGLQLQESKLPHRIKVWEALDLFSSFYRNATDWEPVLLLLGLEEKRNDAFASLSGGQKQRLSIGLALLNDPELLFLDELTTALDPQARHAMWALVRSVRDRGKTIFLTTHFMEEAERLCDRVAIVDHGRIIALDTPMNLVQDLGQERRVVFDTDGRFDSRALNGKVTRVEQDGRHVTVWGHSEELTSVVVQALGAQGLAVQNLRTGQPTLEDVFLALTAREMRD